jgi:hypothetical protein
MVNLHPSQPLKDKFGTWYECDYLDGLTILDKDEEKVSRKGHVVNRYSVSYTNLPEINFFFDAAKNFSILEEGLTSFKVNPPVPSPTWEPENNRVSSIKEGS